MALCQHFLGNNMAPNSHVTAVNQSKLGPELARLSLYTALEHRRTKCDITAGSHCVQVQP